MQDANWTNDSFMEDNRGKMAVFFHTVQVQNNFKTMTEKRPIFEEKIFLKKFQGQKFVLFLQNFQFLYRLLSYLLL